MKIGISATLVHRGRSAVGRYLVPLVAALLRHVPEHQYLLYVLEDDLPLFAFARDRARVVVVGRGDRRCADDVLWHHFQLPSLAREHRLDVLHVPTERRMLWLRPCPLVTTVHHLGPFRRPRARTSRGSCPGAVFRSLARRQDELLVPSAVTAEELSQLTGVPRARITATPPGADVARLASVPRDLAAAELIRRRGIHPPFFLVVGAIEDAPHAHAALIRAFNRFKTVTPSPWQLVFITGGATNTQRVRQLTRQSPYAADVHCVEQPVADELPLWYRAAGGLVHTPVECGFSSCVMEALAAGCPTLVTASRDAVARFGEAVLYSAPDDLATLHDRLRELATDVASWSRLHGAGRSVAASYDWQTAAELTAEAYERAAAPRTREAPAEPWPGVAQRRA